jgi:hypothetical protein
VLDAGSAPADVPGPSDPGPDGSASPDGAAGGDVGSAGDGALPTATITLLEVPLPIAEVCQRFADVQCARWKECTPERFATDYRDDEICRLRREAACRTDFVVAGRNETATDRAACAQAWSTRSCRDVFFNRRVPACDAPPGTFTLGQACFRTSQCAPGLACQLEAASCGTCQMAIPAGGDCGWWAGGCTIGTSCHDDRCLPLLEVGESCKTSSAPCEAGLECLAGGCAEQMAESGASCAAGDLCDPVRGLRCNYLTELCEPVPPPVAPGEPCGTFDPGGGALSCSADANCFSAEGGVNAVSRCVARADLGQACDPAMGRICKTPGACARGLCVMPTVVRGGTYRPPLCR